jgi:hypothetical protein
VDIVAPLAFTGLALNTTYLLRVWNAGGAEAGTFTVCDEAVLVTGLAGRSDAGSMRLMPVPAKDELSVDGIPNGTTLLELLDLQGRVMMQRATNGSARITLDVTSLATGTYLLRAIGGTMQVQRFVVE